MLDIYLKEKKIAEFTQDKSTYLLNYKNSNITDSITLSLPNSKSFYHWEEKFPPYFESFLPEGYLFEVFKNILTKKYGYIDDYLLFCILSPNILGRLQYKSDYSQMDFSSFDINEILHNDTEDTFNKLLNTFLDKNAISGVQPKSVALLRDKETLHVKEYIVKTWGSEYPYLAENEYFCLKAVQKAGVAIPNIKLSQNKKFLLVENFIFQDDEVYGFEELISLMGKNKVHKYQGSYEQLSKVILQFTRDKATSMLQFFKTIVMSYLLKNGDAHLKNFALLFSEDFSIIKFAPAYDIVNTTAYIFKDKPALTMDGKKTWHGKKTLVEFGQKYCLLSKKESLFAYEECKLALAESVEELEVYMLENKHFKSVGQRMCDAWKLSLLDEAIKEISDDTIRTWKES